MKHLSCTLHGHCIIKYVIRVNTNKESFYFTNCAKKRTVNTKKSIVHRTQRNFVERKFIPKVNVIAEIQLNGQLNRDSDTFI